MTAAAQTAVADQKIAKPIPRIGLLSWSPCDRQAAANRNGEWTNFLQGLRDLGYMPGENVTMDCRSADERYERFPSAAAELAQIPVDVIVTTSESGPAAASRVTFTIPVIALQWTLFGQTYATPAFNVTGTLSYVIELTGKRLELLKEADPTIQKIAVLSNPNGTYRAFEARTKRAAEELKVALVFYRVKEPTALADTFALMTAQQVDAVFMLPDLMFASQASHIADLAIKHRLPTMAWDSRLTQSGILLGYSSRVAELERRLAFFVDRILHGAPASSLPIEQPTDFSLSINLRTARDLGLALPRSILIMANEVVE